MSGVPTYSYATVEEYRTDTGDTSSSQDMVESGLLQQSAKLRAVVGITAARSLNGDQMAMARSLVVDAVRKALVPPSIDGLGGVTGAKQASFSANGFQGSYTLANPSGSAYFDGNMLKAFKRSLGPSQRMLTVMPRIGGPR